MSGYNGYLQKYIKVIDAGLKAGLRAEEIAADLYNLGVRPHWTNCRVTAIDAMKNVIKYIHKRHLGGNRGRWTVSTPESVDREIRIERGE